MKLRKLMKVIPGNQKIQILGNNVSAMAQLAGIFAYEKYLDYQVTSINTGVGGNDTLYIYIAADEKGSDN